MRKFTLFLFLVGFAFRLWSQELTFPLIQNSVRFAVIGDSGDGNSKQYELARWMVEYEKKFPFEFVIMLGDNIYGGDEAPDFEKKFAQPYKVLLDNGVSFYASLGNHDHPNQCFYKLFNMKERRYYEYTKGSVRFFVLDSNYMSQEQLEWLEKELRNSASPWKICYFHHPLYSSGATHGSATDLRLLLEPLFVKYHVDVVFSGHEHFYERIKPQKGIYYFISGAASKLRRNNLTKTALTDEGFDKDLSFMLVEIAGDDLYFQVISRTGKTVDSGVIHRTTSKTGEVTSSLESRWMKNWVPSTPIQVILSSKQAIELGKVLLTPTKATFG